MKQKASVVKPVVPPVVVKPSKEIKNKKADKAPAKVEVKTDAKATPKKGIGKLITEKILEGKLSNNEILELVKKTWADCKTTYACIAWYKSTLRKRGEIE